MSIYRYSGVTDQGKDVQGTIDAANPKSAKVKLRQNGIFPVTLSERTTPSRTSVGKNSTRAPSLRPARTSTLTIFTKQCSLLLEAKVPLMRTLSILMEQLEDHGFRTLLSEIHESIKEGQSLSDALSRHTQVFSPMYVQMVKASEVGGDLSKGLSRLADYLERQAHLKGRLINTLMYPAILASVGLLILIGLITFVIPQITGIFSEMREALPLPTVILLGVSTFLNRFGIELSLLSLIGITSALWGLSTAKGRFWWDCQVLGLPIVGKIHKHSALSRFAQTLGTLLNSGVSLLEGLHIAKKVLGNQFLETLIEETAKQVREGQSVADPLSRNQTIPALFVNMIALGEQTGELGQMLLKVGQVYDLEIEIALTRWLALLEPLLVLAMGFLVLFIVLAILLPLFQMSQVIH